MIRSTIREKFTEDELAYLLAFEANEKDKELVSKRNEAYEFLDLSKATRLETLTALSQRRLHRRYERIIH